MENKEESYLDWLERENLKDDETLQHFANSLLDPEPGSMSEPALRLKSTPAPKPERNPGTPAWIQNAKPQPKPTPKTWRQLLAMFWVYLGTKLDHPERYLAGKMNSLKSLKRPKGDDFILWITVSVMGAGLMVILFTALAMAYVG